jgi:hypothetical protein
MPSDSVCKRFLVTYHHEGAAWILELRAKDEADARARLRQLGSAKVEGEIAMVVPASIGWLARAAVVVRNFVTPTR